MLAGLRRRVPGPRPREPRGQSRGQRQVASCALGVLLLRLSPSAGKERGAAVKWILWSQRCGSALVLSTRGEAQNSRSASPPPLGEPPSPGGVPMCSGQGSEAFPAPPWRNSQQPVTWQDHGPRMLLETEGPQAICLPPHIGPGRLSPRGACSTHTGSLRSRSKSRPAPTSRSP